MYQSVYPIENRFLTGKENNVLGPSFPKLHSFNDSNVFCVGILLIPTTDKDEILEQKLVTSGKSFQDLIHYVIEKMNITTYDGGFIKMSYAMTQGMDSEGMYSTADTLLSEDIYQRIDIVKYRRILFYF